MTPLYYVYILTNQRRTVFYTEVTCDLKRRVYEHKYKLIKGFTSRYNVDKLVYWEQASDVYSAIAREKEVKDWRREKKLKLIKSKNPFLKDLSR